MSETAHLERDAGKLRGEFIARAREIRDRSRPANVFAAAKDRVIHAAAPIVEPVERGLEKSGAAWVVGAAIGLATLSRKTSKTSPSVEPASDASWDTLPTAPKLGSRGALTLLGLGAAAGVLVGANIPVSETERRVFRAVQLDLKNAFVRASNRGFESLLASDSVRANALKIGLTALAVLMRPPRSERPG